jgi:hypothetical protein
MDSKVSYFKMNGKKLFFCFLGCMLDECWGFLKIEMNFWGILRCFWCVVVNDWWVWRFIYRLESLDSYKVFCYIRLMS